MITISKTTRHAALVLGVALGIAGLAQSASAIYVGNGTSLDGFADDVSSQPLSAKGIIEPYDKSVGVVDPNERALLPPAVDAQPATVLLPPKQATAPDLAGR